MRPIKLADLTPAILARMSPTDRRRYQHAHETDTPRHPRGPNKTESEYAHRYLCASHARFEALVFKLENGHRYTPDWITVDDDGQITCHEVKGPHRHGSHGRSRMAWDQSRVEWPTIHWVWAVRGSDGVWIIESGDRITTGVDFRAG